MHELEQLMRIVLKDGLRLLELGLVATFWIGGRTIFSFLFGSSTASGKSIRRTQTLRKSLLKDILPSGEELENLIGDLIEEYNEIPSRTEARRWLYKQLIKSVLPLVYETVKNKLSSRLG